MSINLSTFINCYFRFFLFLGGTDSNKGKSKKWKKILQFPHISQCVEFKPLIGKLSRRC